MYRLVARVARVNDNRFPLLAWPYKTVNRLFDRTGSILPVARHTQAHVDDVGFAERRRFLIDPFHRIYCIGEEEPGAPGARSRCVDDEQIGIRRHSSIATVCHAAGDPASATCCRTCYIRPVSILIRGAHLAIYQQVPEVNLPRIPRNEVHHAQRPGSVRRLPVAGRRLERPYDIVAVPANLILQRHRRAVRAGEGQAQLADLRMQDMGFHRNRRDRRCVSQVDGPRDARGVIVRDRFGVAGAARKGTGRSECGVNLRFGILRAAVNRPVELPVAVAVAGIGQVQQILDARRAIRLDEVRMERVDAAVDDCHQDPRARFAQFVPHAWGLNICRALVVTRRLACDASFLRSGRAVDGDDGREGCDLHQPVEGQICRREVAQDRLRLDALPDKLSSPVCDLYDCRCSGLRAVEINPALLLLGKLHSLDERLDWSARRRLAVGLDHRPAREAPQIPCLPYLRIELR